MLSAFINIPNITIYIGTHMSTFSSTLRVDIRSSHVQTPRIVGVRYWYGS